MEEQNREEETPTQPLPEQVPEEEDEPFKIENYLIDTDVEPGYVFCAKYLTDRKVLHVKGHQEKIQGY
jgi:hypothetical protein